MIKVGDTVTFQPLRDIKIAGMAYDARYVEGEVIKVYKNHRWFSVKYTLGEGTILRTSFHFVDIDETVFIRKRGGARHE